MENKLKNNSSKLLLASLCDKFTKIFHNIKLTRENFLEITTENENLSSMINNEIAAHKQSIEAFQNKIISLQKFPLFNSNINSEEKNTNEIGQLSSEIEEKHMLIQILGKKDKEINKEIIRQKVEIDKNFPNKFQ